MNSTLRLVLAGAIVVGSAHLACSSTTRNNVREDGTATLTTGGTSVGGASSSGTTSTSGGFTASTSSGSVGSTGVGGGTGALTGVTSTGGSGTSSAATNSGSDGPVDFQPMACNEGELDCVCDDNGCLLTNGGVCTRSEDCVNGFCGVTQDAVNVCCAEVCSEDQVCLGDGSACEAEEQCPETEFRCNTDYQQCVDGVWQTVAACGTRGCDLTFGGCLLAVGAACTGDEDCGEGTCQAILGGSQVCCTASCGDCEVCSESGTDCAVPPLSELGDDCACTEGDVSKCVDSASCTREVCNDGVCENPIQAGFCLIEGQCYSQNTPQPGNPCHYCDAGFSQVSWTNSSTSTACNDGKFCNGGDFCDGAGSCAHEFTGNRCTGNAGDCDSTTCDESRDTCFYPSSEACNSWSEEQCSSDSCGSDVQSRSVTQYCSGFSGDCNGNVQYGGWSTTSNCSSDEACIEGSFACGEALGCGTTFCDESTNKCWTVARAGGGGSRTYDEAVAYCNALDLGDRNDWQLPTIQEFIALSRGCNGFTGEPEDVDYYPDCQISGGDLIDCAVCPEDEGPTSGCYSPTGFTPCDDQWGHITDSLTGTGSDHFTFSFRDAYVGFTPFSADVRCVLDR